MNWYVLYTRAKTEMKVAEGLRKLGIESFCPVTTSLHQWSDRKKRISTPLFRSYVFVRLKERERKLVYSVPGVVRYLYWLGKPATVKEAEIEVMKAWTGRKEEVKLTVERLMPRDRPRILSGAQRNQGAVVKKAGPGLLRLILVKLECILSLKTEGLMEKESGVPDDSVKLNPLGS